MAPSDHISPKCQLVNQWVRHVVCSIEANYGGQKCPGSERASAERRHGAVGAGINAAGEEQGGIGLDAVDEREG